MVEKVRKFLRVRSSLNDLHLTNNLASKDVNQVVSQIEDSNIYNRHFWRRLADVVDEKAQLGEIKNLDLSDTIDLTYRVEMKEAMLTKEGYGTVSNKQPTSIKFTKGPTEYAQRITHTLLNQFERFPKLVREEGIEKIPNLNAHQTSKLAYLLGHYSYQALNYPVGTRKLLQHQYWSHYAWEANLWPQLDQLLKLQTVYLDQFEVAETSYGLIRAR